VTTEIIVSPQAGAIVSAQSDFDAGVDLALRTVAQSSRRIYETTYSQWRAFAEANDVNPADMLPVLVGEFLAAQAVTLATRQRKLSMLRALAKIFALDTKRPERRMYFGGLQLVKAPEIGAVDSARELRALTAEEVASVRAAWRGKSLIERRNRALIAVLFDSGVRRAEAAMLRWSDVNFKRGTVLIRLGKRKKQRESSLFGDDVIESLKALRRAQGGEFEWVFCHVDKHGNPHDKPITGQLIYLVVKQTERMTGIGFSPHDARRSLITGLLDDDAPLHEVQAQAGHTKADTTMRYAKARDAGKRREKYDPYGGK
jgi:integrase